MFNWISPSFWRAMDVHWHDSGQWWDSEAMLCRTVLVLLGGNGVDGKFSGWNTLQVILFQANAWWGEFGGLTWGKIMRLCCIYNYIHTSVCVLYVLRIKTITKLDLPTSVLLTSVLQRLIMNITVQLFQLVTTELQKWFSVYSWCTHRQLLNKW